MMLSAPFEDRRIQPAPRSGQVNHVETVEAYRCSDVTLGYRRVSPDVFAKH
jgi:hypothetical protein